MIRTSKRDYRFKDYWFELILSMVRGTIYGGINEFEGREETRGLRHDHTHMINNGSKIVS